ncbi:MAG: glycosyltransferase [Bacteroidales bacterium]|nr:glycosyltransferase [Bacteroidales bacterium]
MINDNNEVPSVPEKVVPKGKTLVFAPHPDDEILGCGGAIARYIQQGDEVKVVIVTDGGFPVNESQKTADYPETRKQESLAAAKILGYGRPDFLDFKDGFLKADEELIASLHQIIIDFEPQNIFLPSDTEIHPDHLALNKAAVEAAKRFPENINLFFYEIGQPLRPNVFLDITDLQPTLDRAMDCFVSQLAVQDYKTHIRSLHAYRSYTLGKEVKFAEAYRLIKSSELKTGEMLWQEKQKSEVEQTSEFKTGGDFPLISVIVRTMNRPQLPEALESIAAQTYPNIEVIVVDARGEKPLDLGDRCGRFPLRINSKSKPLNRPEAANVGLDEVKGAYFCFLDEDDLLLPDHIMVLHQSLLGSKEVAAYSIIKKVEMATGEESWLGSNFDFQNLLRENFIPIHAILFCSKLLKKGCSFDPDFEIYEDWDFLIQAAHHGDFRFVETQGGIYRNFGSSYIHEHLDKVFEFRRKIYLKWIPLLSDEQFDALIPSQIKETNKLQWHNKVLKSQIEKFNSENTFLRSELALIKQSVKHRVATKLSGIYLFALHKNPLMNYKKKLTQSENLKFIKESGLFDVSFYLIDNPDVKKAGIDPMVHYLEYGGFEDRNPSENFDSAFYLNEYPDVKASKINPLLHYVKYGKKENRRIKPEIFQPSPFDKEKFVKHKQTGLFELIQSSEQIDLTWPAPQISVILVLYNKAELTFSCLKSLRDYADVPLEIIVVDNHSTDQTENLLKKIKVSHVIRNSENLHFLKACNQALEFVSTPNILFLNNDTEIGENAISSALKTLNESADYGAVGAKLILPNGTLQEAGTVIWRDGGTFGYGRGESPDLPEYNFKRIVDYCSGAFLLTHTTLFKKHGGFDTQFAPAYYEETDYCLWLQAQGFHVIYDPNTVVKHYEFGSADQEKIIKLHKINQEKFAIKHIDFLDGQFEYNLANLNNARFAASQQNWPKILYIDDRIPHPDLGQGYPRSHAIIHTLAKMGYQITLFSNIFINEEDLKSCYRDISPYIEVIHNSGYKKFGSFISERKDYYDFIWISRPHNMQFNFEHLEKYRSRFQIIYDAEAIFTERIAGKSALTSGQISLENYNKMMEEEISWCMKADWVVSVSEKDAAKFRAYGLKNVHALGHVLSIHPDNKPFDNRKDLLFVGNLDSDDSPNVDSVLWFVHDVFPIIQRIIPDIALHIVGSNRADSIQSLVAAGVNIYGRVEDIKDFYQASRIFIAPTRYSAGIPYKIHEAASYGLPVVCTRLLADQLHWENGELLVSAAPEKNEFAEAVVKLYANRSLWEKIRKQTLQKIEDEFTASAYEKAIEGIFKKKKG